MEFPPIATTQGVLRGLSHIAHRPAPGPLKRNICRPASFTIRAGSVRPSTLLEPVFRPHVRPQESQRPADIRQRATYQKHRERLLEAHTRSACWHPNERHGTLPHPSQRRGQRDNAYLRLAEGVEQLFCPMNPPDSSDLSPCAHHSLLACDRLVPRSRSRHRISATAC